MDEELDRVVAVQEDDTSSDEDTSSENDMADVAEPLQGAVNYDTQLPTSHSSSEWKQYLGQDLEEVAGRTVLEDEEVVEVPIVPLPGVVLFPGQTLPLYLFHPSLVAMVRQLVAANKTFGIVTPTFDEDSESTMSDIGTTAEILAYKEENDEASGVVSVRCKAIGRQRFEVKSSRRQTDGILMAKTRIRSERIVERCLQSIRPYSQYHARLSRRHERTAAASLTRWPQWLYDQYDSNLLATHVTNELLGWNETLRPCLLPPDPASLSYWVAGNLPMDDTKKLTLLGLDCDIQRLRFELSLMQHYLALRCKECNAFIMNKSDIFCMSVTGPLGTYVNTGGYVHETITAITASNLRLVGRSSTENSWFPGYAWTIAQCHDCGSHMGWKFTSVKSKAQPSQFWGVCRSAVVPSIVCTNTETSNNRRSRLGGLLTFLHRYHRLSSSNSDTAHNNVDDSNTVQESIADNRDDDGWVPVR